MREFRLAFRPVASSQRVDGEGLLETTPSQRGDDHGVATLHPFHPAEIEVARGQRGPYRTRDVWASLGPIEAESAQVVTGRAGCAKLDPEPGEKTGTCCRDNRHGPPRTAAPKAGTLPSCATPDARGKSSIFLRRTMVDQTIPVVGRNPRIHLLIAKGRELILFNND